MLRVTTRRAAALVVAAGLALGLAACGGGDDSADDAGGTTSAPATTAPPAATAAPPATTTAPPEPEPAPSPEPLAGLPPYTAGFESWDRLNAQPIPPDSAQTQRVGFDAHRGTKNVYVSVPRGRLTRGGDFPEGTILVKAARTDGVITLAAIMRKIRGVDPDHGDWEFIEYKRASADATFATDSSLTGETCWSCHQIAADTDWVFTPLDP